MIGEWANHLWQSTLFAVVAGFLTIAFRQNRAHVRYWLWFGASVKFFVPFTLLMGLGNHLRWVPAAQTMAAQAVSVTMVQVSQPFPTGWTSGWLSEPAPTGGHDWPALAILGVWLCGFGAIVLVRFRMWRRIQAAVGASTPLEISGVEIPVGVQVRSLPTLLEPGVVGLLHPILLLPAGIEDYLSPPQLKAVLAHELWHIRRRDNVTAAIHMVAEALFWFYPLVWWIGARLVDERERACDEEVLRVFGQPQAYAEGIFTICKRYVQAPLVCVSGVGGANLKKRIERIMKNRKTERLNSWRKVLLATTVLAPLAIPIVLGATKPPQPRAQPPQVSADGPRFEVASVKPNKSGDGPISMGTQPGGRLTMVNVPLRLLIRNAYQVQDFQLVNAPDWINSERFDIVAKAAENFPPPTPGNPGPLQFMMRSLLADRFQLALHHETRDLPIYALEMARSNGSLGPQLHRSTVDCAAIAAARQAGGGSAGATQAAGRPQCGVKAAGGQMMAGGLPISQLTLFLSPMVQRVVTDRTGLPGTYDFDLKWTPEQAAQAPSGVPSTAPDPDSPSIFTALREQLGLKLESAKGPVDVLVIDKVERPTPN